MSRRSVVVIGGGVGGLFTAALLSKEGFSVTVLEKNAIIGGGLQSFRRFGETFDTGMHIIGGMHPGGNTWRICRYLGILPLVDVRAVDADCADRIFFAEDGASFCIAKGRTAFIDRLAGYFPSEREGIEAYVAACYRLTREVPLFHLRPSEPGLQAHSGEFLSAADAFIASYVSDPRLRSLLAYMNPFYGGRGGQTPAYIHAIINVLYIDGAARFVGGSVKFAHALASVVEAGGGQVLTSTPVARIDVENRQVRHVETADGRRFQADHYVSSLHPATLLSLTDAAAFPRSYRERIASAPDSYSAFALYVKLRREARFPYINHAAYLMTRYEDVWRFGRTDRPWPLGLLFMTPPETAADRYSTKALITAPMAFDAVREWADTTTGRRGSRYAAWKRERTAELLAQAELLQPGLSDAVEAVEASSPLTIRDYYGARQGGISGLSKDVEHMALSQLPVRTKVANLLLTGQSVNLHGLCGTALTALLTCDALLGRPNAMTERILSFERFTLNIDH